MGTFMSPSCEEGMHFCDGLCDEKQYTDGNGDAASCECKCHLIVTVQQNPPIPTRNFDWLAYIDPENGPFGHGRTEQEAIEACKDEIE